MRAAAAIAAGILTLAACKVDVEGAPCRSPGDTTDCPSGQACGVDAKCSARATECLDPSLRCVPDAKRCSAQGERVETCTKADPCGAWEFVAGSPDCAASTLVCAERGGTPSCECDPAFAGPEFAADPTLGSPAGTAPFPTGADSPPTCRFRSLAAAVARAGQVGGSAAVRAYGAAGAEVAFDAASGDGPLTIPANVTVIGASGAASTILRAPTPGALVTLEGTLQGFELDAGTAGTAVATSCGAVTPTLTAVEVDGGGAATVGVEVSGACGATLTDVDVAGIAGPALYVHADPSAEVGVHGGTLRNSGVGARITGGKVTLGFQADRTDLEIVDNVAEGVLLEQGAAIDALLFGTHVHGNGGTGIVVNLVSPGSSVAFKRLAVYSNGATAPRMYGGGAQRAAGGILVVQAALPFAFVANQVWKNAGDQLVFDSSGTGWNIGADACGFEVSIFACPPEGAYAVAVNGGTVAAGNTYWPGTPVSAYVSQGVTTTPYCNNQPGYPAVPPCP